MAGQFCDFGVFGTFRILLSQTRRDLKLRRRLKLQSNPLRNGLNGPLENEDSLVFGRHGRVSGLV